MADKPDWQIRFEQELGQAEAARNAGNEGKARVCARRAAGVIIEQYFRQQGITTRGSSAYHSLRHLADAPGLPAQTRKVAEHFLLRITPSHDLPIQADLIEEARFLARELLDYSI